LYFTSTTVGLEIGLGSTDVGVGSTDAVTDDVALGARTTPLFQVSFAPDLMQVNFLPAIVWVSPAFAHLVPGVGADAALAEEFPAMMSVTKVNATRFDLIILFLNSMLVLGLNNAIQPMWIRVVTGSDIVLFGQEKARRLLCGLFSVAFTALTL